MTKTPGGFATVLSIPVGTYQYKFIVDGNWKHAPAADVEKDEHGNLNNVIEVKPHVPGKLLCENGYVMGTVFFGGGVGGLLRV